MSDTDIAIIGMACRFPGAENIQQFWHNLVQGVESLSQFTDYHPQSNLSPDHSLPFIKVNNLIKDFDSFDADFFDISEHEAKLIDPQHRLFLECAWTALEHAGYALDNQPSLTGLYAGVYANYYLLRNIYPNNVSQDPASELSITLGNEKDHLTTYTAYKLNLRGPVMTVQATCSSSLAAVHLACESLLTYSADMMLAGGVTISVPQIGGYYYQGGGLLSADGRIRAFASDATGTVYSNGVGVVVLKRLADAIRDRDTIFAVIKGSGLNNDGSSKIGYIAPSIEGQVAVIKRALRNANVDPTTISYLEGHGTGTSLGDNIEIEALNQAYGKMHPGSCALGSVKTNIGHLGPASGLSALIKVAFSLYHKYLPPTLNCREPHEKLDPQLSPFYVLKEAKQWDNQDKRRAGISSFGLGGTNVHMIVEEAPEKQTAYIKTQDFYIFCLSAKNATSLQNMLRNMKRYLISYPDVNLRDLAYTLQVGRKSFAYRFATTFRLIEDLSSQIDKYLAFSPQFTEDTTALFLFLTMSEKRIGELIPLIKTSPQLIEHINQLIQTVKPLGWSLNIDWQNRHITAASNAMVIQSSKLFRYLFFNTLMMPWLNIGSPIQGIIAEGFELFTAICFSQQISFEQALPFILELERRGFMSNDQLPALIKNHTSTIPLYYLKDNQIVLFKEIDNISFQPSKQTSISDSHLIAFSKEIPRCLFTLDGWIKGCQCDDVKEYPYYPSTFEELYKQLIAQLWQSGISINWSQFYDKSLASRIPLPTYAFHRKRYWLDEKQTSYTTHQAESFISDTSDVMQKMIGLWQQFLGIEEIDGESNFFEKGGTSLSATSLITGIQKQFGIEIELKHLFEDPTVKGITNFVLDKLLLQVSDEELEALMGEPHG